MAERFRAILAEREGETGQRVRLAELTEADLMDGDVDVAVEATTVNYKDGLALTGRAPIIRRLPLVPGIDLAGTVTASSHADWKPGDRVVLNGWGIGESHHGGYATRARVSGDWLVRLPDAFTPLEAMAIGTAGYTAMLCIMAIERAGVTPADGPVVVTGAAGGVGSIAVALLARAGWHVVASTGRPEESDYLKSLGAAEIIERGELSGKVRPLASERFAAGVDSVGSQTLANLLSHMKRDGAVAACGLAGGMDLPGSVAPFILRNVSLLGISSVYQRKERRIEAWARLASDLDRRTLASMTRAVGLGEVIAIGEAIVEGRVRGRVAVEMAG